MMVKSVTLCVEVSILLLHYYSAAIPVEKFYPFGESTADQSLPRGDDITNMTNLSTTFPFFDTNYTTLEVSINGLILFSSSLPSPLHHNPSPLPLDGLFPFVAPFWADVDTSGSQDGTIWRRETKNSTVLNRAREDIQTAFETPMGFQPQLAFVATWDRVNFFGSNINDSDQVNTFQCVLVTDGSLSFVIFLYGEIQWAVVGSDNPAVVGVNVGDGVRQQNVSESLTEEIININTTSNTGVPGVWVFRLFEDDNITSLDPPIIGNCSEITSSESGFAWPESPRSTTAYYVCPNNPSFAVSRECTVEGLWLDFDERGCGVLAQELEMITMMEQDLLNVRIEDLVAILSEVVNEGSEIDQTEINFNTISNTLANVTSFVTGSNTIINETVIANVTQTVNSLLQWAPSAIEVTSSSRIVESFETLVSLYAQQVPVDSPQNFSFTSLNLVVERSSIENFQRAGRTFAVVGEAVIQVEETTFNELSSQQNAAIYLPPSLFAQITDQADVGIAVGYYEMATLFPTTVYSPSDAGTRQTQVYSNVITATVGRIDSMNIQDLEENVTIAFRLQDKVDVFTAKDSERCVAWDFVLQSWSPEGCTTSAGNADGVVLCHCNHLTNFAVLVDTCSIRKDCLARPTEFPVTISITPSVPVLALLEGLNDSFSNLTSETMEVAAIVLAQVVGGTVGNENEQDSTVLDTTANYLTDLATFLSDSNETISSIVVESVVQVVSSLLQWNPQNIVAASSSSAIQSFEVVVYLFAEQLNINETKNFIMDSLTVVSELRTVESLSTTGRSFTIKNNEPIVGDEGQVRPGQLPLEQDAAISLPASLFQTITDREGVGISFALYNSSTLFPVDGGRSRNEPRRREVGSRVLAANVGPGLNFQNLIENVTIVLRPITNSFIAPDSEAVCVSWSFTLQDWTTEGCTTNIGEDGIVTCSCNHLTNFAILVNSCIREEDCQLPSSNSPALTIISYVGMSISIVSLLATIITLLTFKKLREKDISPYHIQLSLSMIFMLIVSFVLIALSVQNSTDPYGGCVTVSVLVHYFTLVSVMWMAAIALFIFQKVMFVFHKITTKFTVGISIICWTAPLVLVLIPLIVDLANGRNPESDIIVRRPNSTELQSFCFLSHIGAFWGAFLAPILAVMAFNIVLFICVIVVLIRHTRGKAARKNERVNTKTMVRLMISISGVMFLFGLTWLLAILAFSRTGQILFIIFNTLQGFFIFLFFIVFNKEAVELWKEFLSCGQYKSKLLHPSTVSSVAVKKSKQTNNSESKGQSQITESSYYGSDTLTKSNTYEESKVDLENSLFNKAPEQDQTIANPTESSTHDNSANNTSSQNGNAGTAAEKKEKKIMSLKARFRRYTTVKKSKHHVEEVEVDFNADNDSDVEGNAATEL